MAEDAAESQTAPMYLREKARAFLDKLKKEEGPMATATIYRLGPLDFIVQSAQARAVALLGGANEEMVVHSDLLALPARLE